MLMPLHWQHIQSTGMAGNMMLSRSCMGNKSIIYVLISIGNAMLAWTLLVDSIDRSLVIV